MKNFNINFKSHYSLAKVLLLFFLMPFSNDLSANEIAGKWLGSWEGVIPFTIEIQPLTGDNISLVYSQEAVSQFNIKAVTFRFNTVKNSIKFEHVEAQVTYHFTYIEKQGVIAGEASYTNFNLSSLSRKEGDTRIYIPELTNLDKPPTTNPKKLPSAADWINHIQHDLMPYWLSPDALGTPIGNFPTFLCPDGTALRVKPPECDNVKLDGFFSKNINRQYIRTISRQVFAYGVMFHVTGDENALQYAKAGVDYIRQHALDKKTGSVVSYWENGIADADINLRTSQDLAYAQMGLAFYYYLTRDEEVLNDILIIKNYIFKHYFDHELGMMRWTLAGAESRKQDLTAQLDQINAYLLMLVSVLPSDLAKQWKNDIATLVQVMREDFYHQDFNMFWATSGKQTKMLIGTNNDFGHTVKTFWMMYLFAKLEGDEELEDFSKEGIEQTLKYAYVAERDEQPAHWATKFNSLGKHSQGTSWWVYAELDQATATLAIQDPSKINYLTETYDTWLNLLTDKKNHEVWGASNAKGEVGGLKSHIWKNGFHSLEHGLIAYITTAQLNKQNTELYFAFKKGDELAVPYLFIGKEIHRKQSVFKSSPLKRVKVSFSDIDK